MPAEATPTDRALGRIGPALADPSVPMRSVSVRVSQVAASRKRVPFHAADISTAMSALGDGQMVPTTGCTAPPGSTTQARRSSWKPSRLMSRTVVMRVKPLPTVTENRR